jgi:hypothetical protein
LRPSRWTEVRIRALSPPRAYAARFSPSKSCTASRTGVSASQPLSYSRDPRSESPLPPTVTPRSWRAKMRAVLAGLGRTATDVGGHAKAGSARGNGRCGITGDLRGTRRTRTELVKSPFTRDQIRSPSQRDRLALRDANSAANSANADVAGRSRRASRAPRGPGYAATPTTHSARAIAEGLRKAAAGASPVAELRRRGQRTKLSNP